MTNSCDHSEPDKAQKALDSIHKFERIGLQRGLPPLWFGITIAVLGGISITFAGLAFPPLYIAPIGVFMVSLIVHRILKADVKVKPLLSTRAIIGLIIGTMVIFLPLVLFAQATLDSFGPWVALSAGVGFAIFCLGLSVFERHKYLARISVESY